MKYLDPNHVPSDNEIDEKGTKFEVRIDPYHGLVTINVLEVLNQMTDEAKWEFASEGGWWPLITPMFVKELCEMGANETFNSDLHRLRKALLTSEHFSPLLSEFLKGIVTTLGYELQSAKRYDNAYWHLRGAVQRFTENLDPSGNTKRVIEQILQENQPTKWDSVSPQEPWVDKFVEMFMESFFENNPECILPTQEEVGDDETLEI